MEEEGVPPVKVQFQLETLPVEVAVKLNDCPAQIEFGDGVIVICANEGEANSHKSL